MDFKTIALLTAVLLAATTLNTETSNTEFAQFKGTFGKSYGQTEEVLRQAIFIDNLAKIAAHNADLTQTYTMKVTPFADMTQEEFESTILMPTWTVDVRGVDMTETVADVDWVSNGAVTGVKDQGRCGSCWAFSTVGSFESYQILSTGVRTTGSEQQLVDCNRFPQLGCNGGRMDTAFTYIKNNGLCTESSYSYESGDSGSRGSCRTSGCDKLSFNVSGSSSIVGTSALSAALLKRPVSVAVDASNWSLYGGGVFSNCSTGLNHGVLLVGQNSSYQTVKNSWSVYWGESGYIRLANGNTCGIANDAVLPN